MLPRFVIVPALPVEKESYRKGSRFYAKTVSGGFDIYDNKKKMRLKPTYPAMELAEAACETMNRECRNPDELFTPLRTC